MTTELLNNPAERRKQVRLRVRPDLQIVEQRYEGKIFFVVKDPVCLKYYRFNKQEYFVFDLFDGTHTMEDIRLKFEDEFKPHRLEFQDLEAFARQLVTAGLVQHESGGAGTHLFNRRAKQRRMKRFATLTNILYVKIPVFDPDRLLDWMYKYTSWIFTWWFFALSVGLMLSAAFHVLLHFETFYEKLPQYEEFFAFRTVLYMWISLGIVKVIHEFGHGLSCKAFKGECHEMGFLLMCLSPALYANVTDAWTVADKWKRIIISFAGIYVELVIAAISTFVWWYTPHLPFVNNIAMALMVLCSVSTVLFNANPLMRFDGYYMMADWLEIPNLRERANRYLTNSFLSTCLGIKTPAEHYMAPGRKVLFVVYAIASYIYRWVITFSIIFFLSGFLGPQLKILSQMLATFAFASMFIWPMYRMVKNIKQRGRLPDMKKIRVYVTLAVFAAFIASVFLLPLPVSRIRETGLVTVDPDHSTPVGLRESAYLVSLNAREGEFVRGGQVIARFDSRQLREELGEAEAKWGEQMQLAASYSQQMRQGNPSAAATEQLRRKANSAQTQAKQYKAQVDQYNERLLSIQNQTAPRDGFVMSLPTQEELGRQFERYDQQNKPVCLIGDPKQLIIQVPISPVDYRLLQGELPEGGSVPVAIYVKGRTDKQFSGVITQLPQSDAKEVPMPLTQRGGGPLAVRQSGEEGQQVTPLAQVYLIEVELTDSDATITPGTLVKVKVLCQWRTASWWVGRKLAQLLDIGLY